MTDLRLSRLASGEPEIFSSVQGEGRSIGIPSVFCRLSLCNLDCTWCDTKYTWDWTNYDPKTEILRLPTQQIADRINSFKIRNVVITGGEPLLQQDGISELVGLVKKTDHSIEIETNGTIIPTPGISSQIDQWNVSPKLSNSGIPNPARLIPETLNWFANQSTATFKFVIDTPADLKEVKNINESLKLDPGRIVLMPQATSVSEIESKTPWIITECIEMGFRFSTRLHILIWGDERGT